jgi:hypothetical protein
MRIPLGEDEQGYWYPLGKGYYFMPCYNHEWWERAHYRKSTFAEFKEFYPIQIGWNSKYRTNEKHKMYR